MTLSDRKIPILTGINDVPSSTGQPNHPNDSLLCSNYNALIDNELTSLFPPTETHLISVNIYVNSTTGNDNNNGTINNPVATIERGLEIVAQKKINNVIFLYILGNFLNPIIDITNVYPVNSTGASLFIYSTTATITYTDSLLITNKEDINLAFSNINFILESYIDIVGTTRTINFNDCTFTAGANNEDVMVYVSNVVFNNCTFDKGSATNLWCAFMTSLGNILFVNTTTFIGFGTGLHFASSTNTALNTIVTDGTLSIEVYGGMTQLPTGYNLANIAYNDGLVTSDGKLFTANTASAITDATTGTEVAVINSILSALRNYGIIEV